MKINCLQTGLLQTNCYCISRNNRCAVIDPGDDIRAILSALSRLGGSLSYIFLTHAHFDHLLALSALKASYPDAKVCVGEKEDYTVECILDVARRGLGPYFCDSPISDPSFTVPPADVLLKDGDTVFGLKVLHTPGHTAGSVCLLDEKEKILFSGDTIFCGSYGRTDLGGSASDMKASIARLMELDGETVVLSGHGGTTTIGEERGNYSWY